MSGPDHERIYADARKRMMRDMTGGYFDEHLTQVAFEAGYDAAAGTGARKLANANEVAIQALRSIRAIDGRYCDNCHSYDLGRAQTIATGALRVLEAALQARKPTARTKADFKTDLKTAQQPNGETL